MLVDACWTPSVAKAAKPASVRLGFNFTFDANGRQIMRGVVEDPEPGVRPDVTQCVSQRLPPLEIAPPGRSVFVEVPLVLP